MALCALVAAGACTPSRPLAPAQAGNFDAPGNASIHYVVYGSGPPDIVVPLEYWNDKAIVRELGNAHTIAFYDPRGRRRSSALPQSDRFSVAADLDDLDLLLGRLGAKKVTLIGTSYYGGLAARFAMLHPERVEKLVLVGALYPARHPFIDMEIASDSQPANAAAEAKLKAIRAMPPEKRDPLTYCLAYWEVNGPATVADPAFHRTRTYPCDLPNEAPDNLSRWGAGVFKDLGEWNWRKDARQISAPTLIIHGAQDQIVPVASSEEWARLIPNARLVILPNAGHIPWWEREKETLALIKEFIDDSK